MHQVKIVEVTPDMASAWLKNNGRNRPITRARVKEHLEMMRSGSWGLSSSAIMICEDGVLINGQHRLSALVEYGSPLKMLVLTGAPAHAFSFEDTGKPRSMSDSLGAMGMHSTAKAAAAMAILSAYDARKISTNAQIPKLKNLHTEEFISAYPTLPGSIAITSRYPITDRRSLWAAAHLIFSRFDAPAADRFIVDVGEGTMLSDGDPALAVRNRTMVEYVARGSTATTRILALSILAWNARRDGRRMSRMQLPAEAGHLNFPVAR